MRNVLTVIKLIIKEDYFKPLPVKVEDKTRLLERLTDALQLNNIN